MKPPHIIRQSMPIFDTMKWTPETVDKYISEIQQDAQSNNMELIKLQEAYIDFLRECDQMTCGLVYAHGWVWPQELLNRGKEIRASIAFHKQSPPVDLGADLDSIKKRFRLADPDTEFRQDSLMKALDEAFRAGQSDNADTARLDWLEKVVCASGYHVELHGCSLTQLNGVVINTGCGSGPFRKSFEGPPDPHPLRQAIDAAIAQTQNTQGGKA